MLSDGSGSSGKAANAAARMRLRATPRQPTVERAPKHAHGAPARPRMIAPTIVAANSSHQRGGAELGGLDAGDHARREDQLGDDQ